VDRDFWLTVLAIPFEPTTNSSGTYIVNRAIEAIITASRVEQMHAPNFRVAAIIRAGVAIITVQKVIRYTRSILTRVLVRAGI